MTNIVAATRDEPEANKHRGNPHFTELAKAFVKSYPIGTRLSAMELDIWLQEHGELIVPPPDTPKNADSWLGHLQRRHIIIAKLNKSSAHPRMAAEGSVPFKLVAGGGEYLVRSPHEQIVQGEVPMKVLSLVVTKRKQLRYLMESADWSILPPYEKVFAETLNDDLDLFEEHVKSSANNLDGKFAKLRGKLQRAVTGGEITPKNGGLEKFLSPPKEEEGV